MSSDTETFRNAIACFVSIWIKWQKSQIKTRYKKKRNEQIQVVPFLFIQTCVSYFAGVSKCSFHFDSLLTLTHTRIANSLNELNWTGILWEFERRDCKWMLEIEMNNKPVLITLLNSVWHDPGKMRKKQRSTEILQLLTTIESLLFLTLPWDYTRVALNSLVCC